MKALLALSVMLVVSPALRAGAFEDAVYRAGQLLRLPSSLPRPVSVQGAPVRGREPQTVSIDLAPLLDRHFKIVDSFGEGAGKVYLSAQLDLKGDGYLAVTSEAAAGPTLFKLERGMSGQWSVDGRTYAANLSVSVFRKRLNNYIVVKDRATGKTRYDRRIIDLLQSTYGAGEHVAIGDKSYRLFYSHSVDPATRTLDPAQTGLCLIYDQVGEGGDHNYKFYLIPAADVTGAAPVAYELEGQTAFLRLDPVSSLLEISVP